MKSNHHKKAKFKFVLVVLGVLAFFAAQRRIAALDETCADESEFSGFDDNY